MIMLRTVPAIAMQVCESVTRKIQRSRSTAILKRRFAQLRRKTSRQEDELDKEIRNTNMKNPISVGVVGCGYWGPNHIRNFRTLPDCNLKAMCDMNEARLKHLKALYPEVEGVTSYDHMLNGMVWMRS